MSKLCSNHSLNRDKAALSMKIRKLITGGRVKITTRKELKSYPIGSMISYLNQDHYFRIGGFLIKIKKEYFIYINYEYTQKYRVRFSNVKKMWVGDVFQVTHDYISLTPTSQKKTNFPIAIDDIVIYYAPNNPVRLRFMQTKKFKALIQWYQYFHDPNIRSQFPDIMNEIYE